MFRNNLSILGSVLVALVLTILAAAPATAQDTRDSTSYATYLEFRWNFTHQQKASEEDSSSMKVTKNEKDGTYDVDSLLSFPGNRPVMHGVYVSISNSTKRTEYRAGAVWEFRNGLGVGAALRQTIPTEGEHQTQYGPILQYHAGRNNTDVLIRAEAYAGNGEESGGGIKHMEFHGIYSQWYGDKASTVRLGSVTRASYIIDPDNAEKFTGGKWKSASRTLDGTLDIIMQIKEMAMQPLVGVQVTRVSTSGESITTVGTFPFDEDQQIVRAGVGVRFWKKLDGKKTSMWGRVFAGAERISDTGPLGDHSGAYVAVSGGITF